MGDKGQRRCRANRPRPDLPRPPSPVRATARRVGYGTCCSALMCRLQRDTLDRDAMHQAAFALVIVQRIVPGRSVVPECDRAFLPFEAGLEFRPRSVLVEEIQERLALALGP